MRGTIFPSPSQGCRQTFLFWQSLGLLALEVLLQLWPQTMKWNFPGFHRQLTPPSQFSFIRDVETQWEKEERGWYWELTDRVSFSRLGRYWGFELKAWAWLRSGLGKGVPAVEAKVALCPESPKATVGLVKTPAVQGTWHLWSCPF